MGIKPWFVLSETERSENFLYRLKADHGVENAVIGLYVDNRIGNSSVVKFGGWDRIGVKDRADPDFFRCPTVGSWYLQTTKIDFGGEIMFPDT